MKTQSLKNSQIRNTLNLMDNFFGKTEKPGVVAFDGAQIMGELRKVNANIDIVNRELVEKYGLRDEHGNLVPVYTDKFGNQVPKDTEGASPSPGSSQVDPQQTAAYMEEWVALLDKESEISTVELDYGEIRKLPNIRPDLVEALLPFIKFPSA